MFSGRAIRHFVPRSPALALASVSDASLEFDSPLGALRKRRPVSLLVTLATLCLLVGIVIAFSAVFDIVMRLRKGPHTPISQPPPACRPTNRSICFLKMHKCASSSVQNILMRYGETRNLTFALPSRGNLMGYPRVFKRSMAAVGKPPFDILAHHTRFNEAEMRAVLGPDVVFVTIVREPAALFESLYSYFNYEETFRLKLEQIPDAVRNPSQKRILHSFFPGPGRGWLGFNQMSFDLDFDFTQAENASAVDAFLEHVDAVFDLVMVVERLNESLVLLRDLLCWEMDDVVMFKINARTTLYQRPPSGPLADDLRSLNAVDVKLYDYFTKRFDERVQSFGRQRMQRELQLLQNRTEYWYQECVARENRVGRKAQQSLMLIYQVKSNSSRICDLMTLGEVRFTQRLRTIQLRRFSSVKSTTAA
ncbi:hypothetical protein HPB50_002184 [Hyalomma asiaticum]|uniref:Uncharacterized protein n=1 Tax=Hyalomma asiaticum TaxID=266040 RepID=A0ACB7RHU3_HYAAI|nr:hypothetical protein HPB50_002184 [Hyalomma asiaticum]